MDSFHVIPHLRKKGCWSIVKSGAKRALRVHRSKLKAINMGVKLGKMHSINVYLHRRDGTVSKNLYKVEEE